MQPDGTPGELEVFWEGRPIDGPDGFAIARSGNVYVALAGANQILVLSPDGEELDRVPATPIENQQQEVPFDTPASVAFLGEHALVTNHSFFTGTEDHWVVFDVFAGEEGLPLYRPDLSPSSPEPPASDGQSGAPAEESPPPVGGTPLPVTGGATAIVALVGLGTAWALRRRRR